MSAPSSTRIYEPRWFDPLFGLFAGEPSVDIDHCLELEVSINGVVFGQPREAKVVEPIALKPLISPLWALRRLGYDSPKDASPALAVLATRSVSLQAYGLQKGVTWRIADGAPGTIKGDGNNAVYAIPDDLAAVTRQVQITATDEYGSTASAWVVLVPANNTLGFTPSLARLDGQGRVLLEGYREISSAEVLGGVGNLSEVDEFTLRYQAPDDRSATQAVVAGSGFKSSGFSVIDLARPQERASTWKGIATFTLKCNQHSGDPSVDQLYANGRQQVEVTVTVSTQSVNENGQTVYYPLSDREMASLRLVIENGAEIPMLAPGESEMEERDTRELATTSVRNGYAYFKGNAGHGVAQSELAADGSRSLKFYLMVKPGRDGSVTTTRILGRFKSDTNITYTSNPTAEGLVSITGIAPPAMVKDSYQLVRQRPPGMAEPAGCEIFDGNREDPFSHCLKSLDYWVLSYQPVSSVSEVRFKEFYFEAQNDGAATELQRCARESLVRWQSEAMEEIFFSYTGYVFWPDGANETPESLKIKYDPWLAWLARTRNFELPEKLTGSDGYSAGHLLIALHRTWPFKFWFDDEEEDVEAPEQFKKFTARFGLVNKPEGGGWTSTPYPLKAVLTDVQGNRHRLNISWKSGSRNELEVDPMSINDLHREDDTRIHSNAFNFSSFLQGGVDPRTGLYTCSLALPDLKANALRGPVLPMRLSYSPMSNMNAGFGAGWDLNLTCFEPDGNHMLNLHTGERFKVTGSGATPEILERKLLNFKFHQDSDTEWRVIHLNGLVEYLESMGDGANRMALPVRQEAPSGHACEFALHLLSRAAGIAVTDR
ncbi:hypothetical protein [Pseudomonas sp. KNUC1026]|uniref:hypothetical protein n=1 Tax=Pseudomonas sp. KNUC1026 TaxID=2893890 RepID=UPI001F32E5CA|nr:hypothetical protein [Pseudomonas sp. KNUC1026]UFH48279.1 hypothetical protein LN139_14005 [Pseudomonas sp. KNUC1026]